MAARSVEFWPYLEKNFSGIIGDFKKYTVSGVTFPFN